MSDWIEWDGGECPVPPETMVEVRFPVGALHSSETHPAKEFRWNLKGGFGDIIAYRVVSPPPGAPVDAGLRERLMHPRHIPQAEYGTASKFVMETVGIMRRERAEAADALQAAEARAVKAEQERDRLINAIAEKGEAELLAFKRADAAEARVKVLEEALTGMLGMFDQFTSEVDWGRSALSADTIRKVNADPFAARKALEVKS